MPPICAESVVGISCSGGGGLVGCWTLRTSKPSSSLLSPPPSALLLVAPPMPPPKGVVAAARRAASTACARLRAVTSTLRPRVRRSLVPPPATRLRAEAVRAWTELLEEEKREVEISSHRLLCCFAPRSRSPPSLSLFRFAHRRGTRRGRRLVRVGFDEHHFLLLLLLVVVVDRRAERKSSSRGSGCGAGDCSAAMLLLRSGSRSRSRSAAGSRLSCSSSSVQLLLLLRQ